MITTITIKRIVVVEDTIIEDIAILYNVVENLVKIEIIEGVIGTSMTFIDIGINHFIKVIL